MPTECLCIRCCAERRSPSIDWTQPEPWKQMPAFRYACEICGNKRCPHHSDHTLECTGSNEPGQTGSIYQ